MGHENDAGDVDGLSEINIAKINPHPINIYIYIYMCVCLSSEKYVFNYRKGNHPEGRRYPKESSNFGQAPKCDTRIECGGVVKLDMISRCSEIGLLLAQHPAAAAAVFLALTSFGVP